MPIMEGYIYLHRALRENPIYSNSKAVHCWIECLLRASYTKREVYLKREKVVLEPGQFVMGRDEFGSSVGMSGSTAWYWLQQFKVDSMVDIKRTAKGSVVSIINWHEYQKVDSKVNNKKTANEQQMNTYNKGNKVNKDKYIEDAKLFLAEFNKIRRTAYTSTRSWLTNFIGWRKEYSLEQMCQAVFNAQYDPFFDKTLNPELLFRTRNKNGDCNYIEHLLNTGSKK